MNARPSAAPPVDEGLLEEVATQLDLRPPNRDALHTIALRFFQYGQAEHGSTDSFEGVVDSATGVGKTFIIAGVIDYFSALGYRNFAVIAPGSTILKKTIAQFSPGTASSLLGAMAVQPLVVHADNFDNARIAKAFDDADSVKLFVFTVQSLLRPQAMKNRKTHEFREGLGKAFYDHLNQLDDLMVLADEHHTYHGKKFSEAVRGLSPLVLIGLTATPDEKKLAKEGIPVVYRYPLAAAIADRYVKMPVIVGRKDDRTDERTQLLDGGALLRAKEKAVTSYVKAGGGAPVHAVMLVNCKDIPHAQETVAFLRSEQFYSGEYSGEDSVLEVHSDNKEAALAALDSVDDPNSATRLIVQVGMLKEGWDCKSVYVIVSLRASVSEVLTEQTLGRGLRLPFGSYTDAPLLDELDVVAHERYKELLEKSGRLTESFIDHRTAVASPTGADGVGAGETPTTSQVQAPVVVSPDGSLAGAADALAAQGGPGGGGLVAVAGAEDRLASVEATADVETEALAARPTLMALKVPVVRTVALPQQFSLQQVTDEARFRDLGYRLAVDPDEFLKRTRLRGEVHVDYIAGTREATFATEESGAKVQAAPAAGSLDEARSAVVKAVVSSRVVPSRAGEPQQVQRLMDAVLTGAGDRTNVLLLNYARALARALEQEIDTARASLPASTQVTEHVRAEPFSPRPRLKRPNESAERHGAFSRGRPYIGWRQGLYEQAWFDSKPERDLAVIADEEQSVEVWVRLHRDDLPILWNGAEQTYNPDFLVVTRDGTHWVVEVKSDKELPTEDVQGKRQAALAWANSVSAAEIAGNWRYLLAAQRDLLAANGDWSRLVKLTAP